jgi:hypothetical protein
MEKDRESPYNKPIRAHDKKVIPFFKGFQINMADISLIRNIWWHKVVRYELSNGIRTVKPWAGIQEDMFGVKCG